MHGISLIIHIFHGSPGAQLTAMNVIFDVGRYLDWPPNNLKSPSKIVMGLSQTHLLLPGTELPWKPEAVYGTHVRMLDRPAWNAVGCELEIEL